MYTKAQFMGKYAFLCASMHNLNKGNNWQALFFIANYDVNMEYDSRSPRLFPELYI